MKVLVIGAAGKTGLLVVKQALAAGHKVTALVHAHEDGKETKADHQLESMNVEIVHGDVRNPSRLDQVMMGQDAVIDVIGGKTPFLGTDLESSAAQVVIEVMKRNYVKRLIVVSVLGAGESKEQAGFFYEHILMPVFLRGAISDKERMEHEIQTSGLEFVIVRPPMLSDGDATGSIHVVEADEKASKITRADLANFLVDQLQSNTYVGQAVVIENR